MSAVLLPCPFCGGDARHLPFHAGFNDEKAICDSCEFSLSPTAWNRRPATQVALTDALPRWIDDQKGRDPGIDDLIHYIEQLRAQRCIEARNQQGDAVDAARYRWLRLQDWFDNSLCVLRNPKDALQSNRGLGADCPSRDRLDAAIDAAIEQRKADKKGGA